MINLSKNSEELTSNKEKIRVIQGNDSELPINKGDFCWSGLKSFTDERSTIRKTLFIRKNIDKTRDLSVFDSEFDSYRQGDKMYLFKVISKPKVLINAPTNVHLMSSSKDKLEAISLVEGKICNRDVQRKKAANGKKLHHTLENRTCYKCMRFLPNTNFTKRSVGTYFSACKECNKIFKHTRRARLAEAGGKFTRDEFEERLKKYPCCPMCSRNWEEIPLPKGKLVPWTADHIVPINPQKGGRKGTNDISNIQPLCFSCNSKKGNRDWNLYKKFTSKD